MGNTTKDLNRTLKRMDLMSIAVGQIIGNNANLIAALCGERSTVGQRLFIEV